MSDRHHRGHAAAGAAILLALSSGCGAEADGKTAGEMGQAAHPGGSTAEDCMAEYPATQPFDVGEALEVPVAPNEPPGARSIQTIAEECRAGGGVHCSTGEFISRSAALCIAEAEEVFPADEKWRQAGLVFAEAERAVWWTIELTYPSPSDPSCGRMRLIRVDAVTGRVLERATLGYCS